MQNHSSSVLYLLPVPIAEGDINSTIPLNVVSKIINIQTFIVENAKTFRQFYKRLNSEVNWSEIRVVELDKHNSYEQNEEISEIFKLGGEVGLLSESGLPCIADPGHHIVRLAHERGWIVRPMVGPSSILMALISSGMNGQCFKFNGYLPNKPDEKRKAIMHLEKECNSCTQLFIEAPYRNDRLLHDLIAILHPDTRLLLAIDISGENERILSRKVSQWKGMAIEIGKVPCMFGIGK